MNVEEQLSNYIYLSKYSRWREKLGRREVWEETVRRYIDFFEQRISTTIGNDEVTLNGLAGVERMILEKKVVPSMRALMTAGKALDRDHAASYNCAAIAISHPRCFDEIFYLLMCGSGVGYSVERQYINKLPTISEDFYDTDTVLKIQDSKIGWAKGLKELIALLYNGDVPKWDLSDIRPAGARLKTFGGRASGPDPLNNLFEYTIRVFKRSAGRKLNSLECHDICCKIANTVIVGSVRRSAMISLSNLTDLRMAGAKSGNWWDKNPERALANNSVAYTEKPDLDSFLKEMSGLYQSKAGERGIINKVALRKKAESCGREYEGDYLANPCVEAILRDSGGFCNLSEVIIRPIDTLEDLKEKVKYAAIIGTLQSTLTDFRYLRKIWKDNAEEERLLGISLTGIMDHQIMSSQYPYMQVLPQGYLCDTKEKVEFASQWKTGVTRIGDQVVSQVTLSLKDVLSYLKQVALETNKYWAELLGINPSKQLTLVKPSGTVSQLCNTSSGIHPRFSPYYLRRVTQDIKDPLTDLMVSQGVPNCTRGEKVVFSFPIKSPGNAICTRDIGAIRQLDLWKIYRDYWCDGNPSQTIYYTDDTFCDVQSWVWRNFDSIGGLSFFPLDDHVYDKEAQPYLEITKEEYEKYLLDFPEIDWSKLSDYEIIDSTQNQTEFSCSGGKCDI